MGFWKKFGQIALTAAPYVAAPFTGGASLALAPVLGAAAAGMGAAANASAHNRGEKFGGQMDLEQQLMLRDQMYQNQQIDREQDNRAGTSDAFRKLLASQRVLSPGAKPQLSKYSVAPRQATDAERSGASALSAEVLARLQNGNPVTAPVRRPSQVDPRLLDASGWETGMGIASAGLGAFGGLLRQRNPYQTPPYNPQVPNVGNI